MKSALQTIAGLVCLCAITFALNKNGEKKNAIVKVHKKKNRVRRRNMNHESRLDMKQDGAQDVWTTKRYNVA